MTASAAQVRRFVDPLEVFSARCDARATLCAVGELDMHQALDELQAAATNDGLVARIGQDAVQKIMAAAFARTREDEAPAAASRPDPSRRHRLVAEHGVASAGEMQAVAGAAIVRERARYGPPKATIDALRYVVSLNDPVRLRAWLDRRPSTERDALKAMLVPV